MKKILSILSLFILSLAFALPLGSISCNKTANAGPIKGKNSPTASNFAETLSLANPKMCIVIDDFGSFDQSGVETMLSCKQPLTCAVMPNVDNTKANIEAIKKAGHEIILHMPMQSHVHLPEDWYGPTYIANYDTPETATKKLEDCLKDFEGVKGLNIHIGSGVSRNRSLMNVIYNFTKEHNLYFLDSRTIETPSVTAAAKDTNSIYLGRDVFLEADKNRSYEGVKFRMLEGARIAQEKGMSIVIGHVGAEGGERTAKAILDTLPEIEKMGVKIVPLSEIYEDMKVAGVTSNFDTVKSN